VCDDRNIPDILHAKTTMKFFAKVTLIIGNSIVADSESVLTKVNRIKITFVHGSSGNHCCSNLCSSLVLFRQDDLQKSYRRQGLRK
jgi:hypothetical protein